MIFDSPCLYQEMVVRGIALSKKYNVKYKYVECYLNDFNEVNHRLRKRDSMISQIKEVNSEEVFKSSIKNNKKPTDYPYMVVDTSRPFESYINEVVNYIDE